MVVCGINLNFPWAGVIEERGVFYFFAVSASEGSVSENEETPGADGRFEAAGASQRVTPPLPMCL
jgi:hypothetical protein